MKRTVMLTNTEMKIVSLVMFRNFCNLCAYSVRLAAKLSAILMLTYMSMKKLACGRPTPIVTTDEISPRTYDGLVPLKTGSLNRNPIWTNLVITEINAAK